MMSLVKSKATIFERPGIIHSLFSYIAQPLQTAGPGTLYDVGTGL